MADCSLQGGRQAAGVLKGFDQLQNMVLDDVVEKGRNLGLVVFRGTAIQFISPEDGYEEIENPFI